MYNSTGSVVGIQVGTRNTSAALLYYYWMAGTTYIATNLEATDGSRYRIEITHSANSGKLYVRMKKGNGEKKSFSRSATFKAANNLLYLGNPNRTQGLPNCVINSVEIYNEYYPDASDKVTEFFA